MEDVEGTERIGKSNEGEFAQAAVARSFLCYMYMISAKTPKMNVRNVVFLCCIFKEHVVRDSDKPFMTTGGYIMYLKPVTLPWQLATLQKSLKMRFAFYSLKGTEITSSDYFIERPRISIRGYVRRSFRPSPLFFKIGKYG